MVRKKKCMLNVKDIQGVVKVLLAFVSCLLLRLEVNML
jgi:hypothetical protein